MTSPGRLLGRHRRTLLAVAGVLFAGIAAALMPPPAALREAGARSGIAALVSAAIVASATLPFLIWRSAARPVLWIALAVSALVAGVTSFAVSGYAERTCTATYAGTPVVIGMELTPLGAAYKQSNPELANDDLLFDAAGVAERIWTPSSIGRCRAFTGGTYFLAVPFLVVCLLATAEAVPATILSPVRWGAAASKPGDGTVAVRYDVFISYRHDPIDRAFVTELVAALEGDGYRVAIDERDFLANASFLLEMERCIRESRFTLAVISARYLESGNALEEAIISKVLDMGDRKRRLIPLVIEAVTLPAWLYGIVGIDCTKRDPLVNPYDKLRATLGAPMG
jgi:TIR domain